jgi:hypothetical protein
VSDVARGARSRIRAVAARRLAGPELADLAAQIADVRGELHGVRERSADLEHEIHVVHDVLATTEAVATLPPSDTLVSVVMPTSGRRPALLAEAIASVRAQSHAAFELLVVDDSRGAEVAVPDDPRIRLMAHDGPRGASAARNTALAAARGAIVAYLDDDNLMGRHWLRAAVWAFDRFPDTDVAYGALASDAAARGAEHPWLQLSPWWPHRMRLHCLIDQNALVHRTLPDRYDEALLFGSDWEFADAVTRDRPPVRIPVVAATYRTRIGGRLSDDREARLEWAAVQRRLLRRRPLRVLGVGVAEAALPFDGPRSTCAWPELPAAAASFAPDLAVFAGPEDAALHEHRAARLFLPFTTLAPSDPAARSPLYVPLEPDRERFLARLDDVRARAADFV